MLDDPHDAAAMHAMTLAVPTRPGGVIGRALRNTVLQRPDVEEQGNSKVALPGLQLRRRIAVDDLAHALGEEAVAFQ